MEFADFGHMINDIRKSLLIMILKA